MSYATVFEMKAFDDVMVTQIAKLPGANSRDCVNEGSLLFNTVVALGDSEPMYKLFTEVDCKNTSLRMN